MKNTIKYLKNFIRDKDVASVTPSSKFCVRRVCDHIDFKKDNIIIEYGAGTGVFSDYLLSHLSDRSELILFETNNEFFEKLEEIEDSRVKAYNDSVEHIKRFLNGQYEGRVDYIISGIPFSFLNDETKETILEHTWEMLKPGGKFLAYQTSGHLKDPLRRVFGNVQTEVEFLNVPPMMIYEARKKEEA